MEGISLCAVKGSVSPHGLGVISQGIIGSGCIIIHHSKVIYHYMYRSLYTSVLLAQLEGPTGWWCLVNAVEKVLF